MSVQAMAWAIEQRVVTDASARHVLLCLANYADKDGRAAFPSAATLSADTDLSERTVRSKLDLLSNVGAIKVGNQAIVAAYIDRADKRPICYDLCVSRGANPAPRVVERGANDDVTGCKPRSNGVQSVQERGAAVAPNPSLKPSSKPNTPITPQGGKSDSDSKKADEQPAADVDPIDGIFEYWKQRMSHERAQLSDGRRRVIRKALSAGYSPHDLCIAIRGCSLTPHNMGQNERGERYDSIELILRDAAQIDRFMANDKTPPKATEKTGSGQIPGWWNSDEVAKQQAALVGVGDPLPIDSRETYHARIRAAIENGGKPSAPIVAPAPKSGEPEAPRVELTTEQKAARSAALLGALSSSAI
ncbi:helix-turn-helix domain-containing protein [Trinickia dinghuensis]|uniref:helix-turn-helix domain-containing protein n=1 Tax=Trinickia dinghuensis TaxID=2291023 RepID=UPI001C6A77B3|nr:helix-turn-helix domain-containing protein [Trinickia dinghuensis]